MPGESEPRTKIDVRWLGLSDHRLPAKPIRIEGMVNRLSGAAKVAGDCSGRHAAVAHFLGSFPIDFWLSTHQQTVSAFGALGCVSAILFRAVLKAVGVMS